MIDMIMIVMDDAVVEDAMISKHKYFHLISFALNIKCKMLSCMQASEWVNVKVLYCITFLTSFSHHCIYEFYDSYRMQPALCSWRRSSCHVYEEKTSPSFISFPSSMFVIYL